jgi:gliding motility-associated protein GldL
MNIGELLKTKRAKSMMGFVYSWGASIVLIGALFKLQHWPYSGYFLGVGLITEAIIFFVSAFEPPLEMPEWSKVYPELREDYAFDELPKPEKPGNRGLEELLNNTELTPALLDKVSLSLNDLSKTAKGISDISSATLATEKYVQNLNTAGDSMSALSNLHAKANTNIDNSVSLLVSSYENTAKMMSSSGQAIVEKLNNTGNDFTSRILESGNLLVKTYKTASEKIEGSLQNFGDSTGNYTENLNKLNKNLSVLNAAVENQLKGSEAQVKAHQKFNDDLGKINEVLVSSAEELKRYRENATKLNQHLEALNVIYGNMLGAMNYKK